MFPVILLSLQNFPLKSFTNAVQYLLSSSMDKTVKLWHITSPSCLKTFSHTDYGKIYPPLALFTVSHSASGTLNFPLLTCITVTCIQFNPVDDRYFISG